MKDYLLTASNGLILLSFPDFKPIIKLYHDQIDFTDDVDLSACGNEAFLKYSGSRFELIELVNSEKNTGKFRTLQEFKITNAVCCACPKSQISHDMAFGLADGSVMLTHYKTQQEIKVLKSKAKEDSLINCSKYLDFSSDHSQLVSVVEDGFIDVFDINRNKLAFEIKKFKEDIPTLAKFRPNATSHLMCVGYTNGKLKLYDTSAQKLVYKSKENHFSLLKDLCFFKQNYVISIGFDSSVIIHDFRSGASPSVNFLSDHHLNSVAVSADDNYYCVGDYKGNLSSYDMRKSNFTPLSTTNISDRIVKKMIFLQSSAREFYDDTVENIADKTVQHHMSSKSKSSELLDSFFNFNITNNNDPSVPIPSVCKITTTNTKEGDLDELKCENTFIRNIKARSTCIFEQPSKGIKVIGSPTLEEELSTSDHRLADVMTRIDKYEAQLKEMKSKIRELKSTVIEMNNFIEMFPKFLADEIENLQRKTRQSDMLVVEKLSMLCASDPQIVELINFILTKHFN